MGDLSTLLSNHCVGEMLAACAGVGGRGALFAVRSRRRVFPKF